MSAISARLSRWTLPIFGCALVNFVIAQAVSVAGLAWPARPLSAGSTLAAVHLVTVGWLTLLMFGALFQFVPVMTGKPLSSQRLTLVALISLETGLGAMVAGFLGLDSSVVDALPAGGVLVVLGVVLAIAAVAKPLLHARPLALPARFVVAGLAFLLVTVLLGFAMALVFALPAVAASLSPLLARGVGFHVLAGLGGWFTLTAMGVSYKLLPMFMLAPEERGAWGTSVLMLGIGGFALSVGAGLAHLWLPGGPSTVLSDLGELLVAAAVAAYLFDVVRLYRGRKRVRLELHNRAATGAFVRGVISA